MLNLTNAMAVCGVKLVLPSDGGVSVGAAPPSANHTAVVDAETRVTGTLSCKPSKVETPDAIATDHGRITSTGVVADVPTR